MIGLFNIVPYFGAIVGVLIAGIITIFTGGIGKAITEVNEYKTNWTDNYFAFYVDGGYSNYGVEGVKAKDKMEIKFVWTKLN